MTDLLCAAENISQRLNAPGPDYARWLEETVGALRVQNGGVIEALVELGVTIAMTNYDDVVEQVTGMRPVTWRNKNRAESLLNGRSHGVLHLHGHWEDPTSVILGIRSYDAILNDRHAQGMLQAIRFTRTVLYVGFGAGLDDPNFGGFLRWTGEDLRTNTDVMVDLIDRFNRMASTIPTLKGFEHVTYIDLRPELTNELVHRKYRSDWDNELHPTEDGFEAVAAKFVTALRQLPLP